MSMKELELVCPKCKSKLDTASKDKLCCNQCNATWDIIEGVPNFIKNDIYWAEPGFTRDNLIKINEEIKSKDWNEVLKNHESSDIRTQYKFISDYGRIDWFDLLEFKDGITILDLGAGMGTMSQALSKKCDLIYSVEPVKERIDFMRSRFKFEKCENIRVIRADIDNLPFEENVFDLIILNGVLEWLPVNRKDMNPRDVQLFYLKMLKKLLKKNGYIYVGIENRMAYSYYLGAPDPHILLKYVTIMPRWISHIICKIKIGDIYRPYLYTHAGYRKLFVESGFHHPDIYSALPSYNEPKSIIHISKHSREYFNLILTSKRLVSKILRKILILTNTLKYFGYAYIIIGRNSR